MMIELDKQAVAFLLLVGRLNSYIISEKWLSTLQFSSKMTVFRRFPYFQKSRITENMNND